MLRSRIPMARLPLILILYGVVVVASDNETVTETTETVTTPHIPLATLEIEASQKIDGIEANSTPSFTCKLSEPGQIYWVKDEKNLTTVKMSETLARFDLISASLEDRGNYTCMAVTNGHEKLQKTIDVRVIENGRIDPSEPVYIKSEKPVNLTCPIHGFPLSNFTWLKGNNSESIESLRDLSSVSQINETHYIMTLSFESVLRKDNGTYTCSAEDYRGPVTSTRHLFVIDKPQVDIDFIKAVGASKIFLNWTVNDGNKPIKKYSMRFQKKGQEGRQFYSKSVGGENTNFVLQGFEKSTEYQLSISAINEVGESQVYHDNRWIKTLDADPIFVPNVSVKGFTESSITVGWTMPSPALREHVHYYTLMMIHDLQTKEAVHPASEFNDYVFVELNPATTYLFKISACSYYTKQCGNWSAEVSGTTMDGVCSPPESLTVTCKFDNISRTSFVSVSWLPPAVPNGQITRYGVELTGGSQYKNERGRVHEERWGPVDHNAREIDRAFEFKRVPANTNYTVRIYGVTRLRSPGKPAIGNCSMPVSVPDKESLNLRTWRKIQNEGRQLFKMYLPRISERNGPICCYRIFLVKLPPGKTSGDLPPPEELDIHSFHYAHASPAGGAYLAEMFDSNDLHSEIFLGDGRVLFNGSINCDRCIGLRPKPSPTLHLLPDVQGPGNATSTTISSVESTSTVTATVSTTSFETTTAATTFTAPGNSTTPGARRRRDNSANIVMESEGVYPPVDGYIDEGSNYTAFIEVVVAGGVHLLPAYSGYLNPLFGGLEPSVIAVAENGTLGLVLQISVALILIIVILLVALCVLHRYTKRAEQGGEENINLRNSFRSLRGRHQLVAASPPDMPPIPKAELLQAYLERHRDSDYGFQQEFELLPDRFTDRTTRASEARENLYKNRYPDIKCYDQTRVRLSQIDGIAGSDYINANFVLGYKERKKFICAQGPMENTVCDYWRMIWEQHLELVLMLTNLEEYSKTKCAKYWPDKDETKNFGDITVEHVGQRAFSDYVIRELKMTRTGERDARTIIQYHFLVWKDFMAPEHPHAILRFIKRVNTAYSLEKGPILVHCSAGVGRTGTLVALDSLLQQLVDEGQVSIFNTVCDLRHQRNFLVQSLKQYIFIYRSLMEMATYGDTEIPVKELKGHVEKLRQRDNGKEKCRMEDEYDELVLNSQKISSVLEERKSFSVGGAEENRVKNRSEVVIPYDRNRVILTPVPGREHSTYINASFIEGYDNSESFIITQDPLETTIADFWRMISEQSISTIVMLSDLNEGPRKCPRYWPEDEAVHEHIRVRYIQSESCPYYTRRELCVANTKTDETVVVTQYQYHGWPTVEGEVPEVTRGVIELVDQTLVTDGECSGPIVIHCNCGSDRSSMFVALSILVQQLTTEKRVDIFTVTKKLRSQRHGMISTFPQYEFLHRAVMNYADLHNIADDETES
ncbi:tyrosine-protein phosphatase 69D isoform X2 [Fopius arisanus]|uniref:protein-tyrosine-phosphatase n=1 Tax=Fopius arisanus TaxID=64838 RepID=A0A9R1STW8_9HYME|nr:PREDICTED: tyrosine-protein phosphatase 69D isoform X2 [Fopius arisanus]